MTFHDEQANRSPDEILAELAKFGQDKPCPVLYGKLRNQGRRISKGAVSLIEEIVDPHRPLTVARPPRSGAHLEVRERIEEKDPEILLTLKE